MVGYINAKLFGESNMSQDMVTISSTVFQQDMDLHPRNIHYYFLTICPQTS